MAASFESSLASLLAVCDPQPRSPPAAAAVLQFHSQINQHYQNILDELLSARSSILQLSPQALSSNDVRLCNPSVVSSTYAQARKRIQDKIAKTFEEVQKNLTKISANSTQSLLCFSANDHKNALDAAFRQWISVNMDRGIDIFQETNTATSSSSSSSVSSDVMDIESYQSSSPTSIFSFTVYFPFLEISMWAVSKDFVEITPFSLFEEFFERLSTFSPLLPSAFSFLSSRRSELTSLGTPPFPQKSKLTLLRTCNGLLKRLSKTTHSALSGSILLLISAAFSIDDKSGLNITGRFHTANVTAIDEENEAKNLLPSKTVKKKTEEKNSKDSIPGQPQQQQSASAGSIDEWLDTRCYKSLWTLQTFFSNPQPLRDRDMKSTTQLTNFTSTLEFVLSAFEAIRLTAIPDGNNSNSSSGTGSAAAPPSSQRHHTEQLLSEYLSSPFFPKYLTSSRLLHLQLRDSAFRRHVLTQALLILDYLLNPTGESVSEREKEQREREIKEREKDPKSAEQKEANSRAQRRSALANSASLSSSAAANSTPLVTALYPWTLGQPSTSCTLTAVQQNTLKNLWTRVLKNVRATPGFPAGAVFGDALLGIINRDRMWTKWKADKCPQFELANTVDLNTPLQLSKKADSENESKKDEKSRRKRNLDEMMGLAPAASADGRSIRPLMGTADLMRLWSSYHTANEELKAFLTDSSRGYLPSLDDFLSRAVDEEKDTTFAPEEDDKIKNDPRFVFRGLRLLASDPDSKSFSAFLNSGSIKRLVEIRAGTRSSDKEVNEDQQDGTDEQKKGKESAANYSIANANVSPAPPNTVNPSRMKDESRAAATSNPSSSGSTVSRNSSRNSDDMDIEKKAKIDEKADSKAKVESMSS